MNDWINPLPKDTVISTALKGSRMESTAIAQEQKPELYVAADVEPFAKGGWKTSVRASVRVFDGDKNQVFDELESLLARGLAITKKVIAEHEGGINV